MLQKLRGNNQKGFTLIELMIVIAIIGILAAIAIPNFLSYRQKGYVASMKADCNSVRLAEEAYMVDNGTYIIAAAATTPIAALVGVKNFSDGNSVAVAAKTDINKDYVVTVTSTKTTETVTYDSTTGETT